MQKSLLLDRRLTDDFSSIQIQVTGMPAGGVGGERRTIFSESDAGIKGTGVRFFCPPQDLIVWSNAVQIGLVIWKSIWRF